MEAAKKLQHFYKVYVKSDRDNSGIPIDPITMEPIPKNKQIRILYVDNNKPIKTQYFDIDTLHTWFKTRREAINPLTNLPFTKEQLNSISSAYKKHKKASPQYIFIDEPEIVEPPLEQKIMKELYNACKNPEDIEQFTNLLITNYKLIESDKINLNQEFFSRNYFLNNETLLMSCVINDNLSAVEELLYYNPSIDKTDSRYDLKAVDLAMMSNKPMSASILRTLLFHGANTSIKTKKGYLNELSNDIEKLGIVYEFM